MSSSVSRFRIYIYAKAHTFVKVKISFCGSGTKGTILNTTIYMHAYQLNKLTGKGITLIGKGGGVIFPK
jgi:hypothetical protein